MAKVILTSFENEKKKHLVDTRSTFEEYDSVTNVTQLDGSVIKVRETLKEICNLICDAENKQGDPWKVSEVSFNEHKCANFFVQMYYQIEKKYNLNRIKLERLLAIVELRYMAQKRKKLFYNGLQVYHNGTIGFGIYSDFIADIVTGEERESNKPLPVTIEMVEKALAETPKFPCGYEFTILDCKKEIFTEIRRWFIEAFIWFGDCESYILSRAIDKFKDEIVCDRIRYGRVIKEVSAEKVYLYFYRPFDYLYVDAFCVKEELKEYEEKVKEVALANGLEIEKLEELFETRRKEDEAINRTIERVYMDVVKFIQSK